MSEAPPYPADPSAPYPYPNASIEKPAIDAQYVPPQQPPSYSTAGGYATGYPAQQSSTPTVSDSCACHVQRVRVLVCTIPHSRVRSFKQ